MDNQYDSDRNYTCVYCDKKQRQSHIIIRLTSFTYMGMFFSNVPVTVCMNLECLQERGAVAIEHRAAKRPQTLAY